MGLEYYYLSLCLCDPDITENYDLVCPQRISSKDIVIKKCYEYCCIVSNISNSLFQPIKVICKKVFEVK